MNSLYFLLCIFIGLIPSLFLSGFISRPFITEDRTFKSIAASFICIACLAAAGAVLWMYWDYNALGFLIGVFLVFLPNVRTQADKEEEETEEASDIQ